MLLNCLICSDSTKSFSKPTLNFISNVAEIFNAELVVRNNTGGEDNGVAEILEALRQDCDDLVLKKLKQSKTVKKPQLIAGLGFLSGMNFHEAKEAFKHDVLKFYCFLNSRTNVSHLK